MTDADRREVLALISAMMRKQPAPPVALEGVVVAGSYDPADGTVAITHGNSYAIHNTSGDTAFAFQRIPVVPPHIGDQTGFVGGERAVLIPTESGYVALVEHGEDDSPGAAVGERWITNVKRLKIKTLGGILIDANDSANVVTIQVAGGLEIVIDGNANTVGLGSATLPSTDGVVRQSDLQAALDDVHTKLQQWAAASLQPGAGATAPPAFTSAKSSSKVLSA